MWGAGIHTTAVALVHEDYVHSGGHAIAGDAQHVLRIGGAFQAMHDNQGQRLAALGFALPVAPASNVDSGFDFDEALFGGRQIDFSREEEAGDGLHVAAA